MKIRVLHRTVYTYAQPVRLNSNELRMTPVEDSWQERKFFLLRVLPATKLRRFRDLNSNWVNQFEIEEPHSRLVIEASSVVVTHDRFAKGIPSDVHWKSLKELAYDEECHPFLEDTRCVQMSPKIWRAAIDIRADSDDVADVAWRISEEVHRICEYVPGVTGVSTTTDEFFETKKGVCQDFAHLALAMCRALKIPARYVLGYLYDAKRKDIRGAHASHAWVEVLLPGYGWFGFDPTNRRIADDHYVTVAFGRDYNDVAPVKGTYWGGGNRKMDVFVHLEEC